MKASSPAKTHHTDPSGPRLHLFRSNRMERLVDAIAGLLAEPTEDAFAPECLLVSGRGMAHWLSLELSRRYGIWSNALYLFPRNFVHWALERTAPPSEGGEGTLVGPGGVRDLDREQLAWAVLATLSGLLEREEFAVLRRYVEGDETGVRYFELCQQIATVFDQYRTYRPELILAWEREGRRQSPGQGLPQLALFDGAATSQRWQATLWRALAARLGHAGSSVEQRFFAGLRGTARAGKLPARIVSLGVDNLPPLYTRILVGLCAHVPVYVFQLAPSELGWQAPRPERKRPQRRARTALPAPGEAAIALEPEARPAHPLVRSLGMLGSEFELVLKSELSVQGIGVEEVRGLFEAPPATTRLSRLQGAILAGREHEEPSSRAPTDESIRIHVCHAPMREVEVLHDQLMALLGHETGIAPEDVIVMMPDVDTYAPLIEAVFQRDHQEGYRIPYAIADRSLRHAAPVVDALARILELTGTRLNAPQILDLLALEVVARRFEILPEDVEHVTRWVGLANIRWGVDAEHHQREGHPYAEANSWRFGLRRLLLGYAVVNSDAEVFGDTLPLEAVEGNGAALLGKLCEFLDRLFSHLTSFLTPATPDEWQRRIGAALDDLIVLDAEHAWEHGELRAALAHIAERARDAGYTGTLTHSAFARLLLATAGEARPARGFLSRGVTFCSMVPLRSIPFRVVALIGLCDGEFPRREQSADFDLIAHPEGGASAGSRAGRRLGDRSRRNEDRYLFLEALLSARDRLILTYTGQSIKDNAELPPSVVVSELLDCLGRAGADLEEIVLRHPLQAFSQRYFDGKDPRLFSYEEYYRKAAESLSDAKDGLTPLFAAPLPAPSEGEPLSLAELVRFFENPTAYLLNYRVGVWLSEREQALASREPQELSPLDRYGVGNQLLELLLAGVDESRISRLVRASGAVPWGTPGDIYITELLAEAQPIAAAVREARAGGARPPLVLHATLPNQRRLSGTLSQRFGQNIVLHQFARVRARHLLRLWINHLAHCLAGEATGSARAVLIGRPEQPEGRGERALLERHVFGPVRDPGDQLAALVELYDEGQRLPLCFFPNSSLELVRALREGQDERRAREVAFKLFEDEELKYDAHLQRVYATAHDGPILSEDPALSALFERLSRRVFEPLLDHLEGAAR